MSSTTGHDPPAALQARRAAAADPTVRTYHGRPVLKQPEWTWEVPWYLFLGGLGGVSSALSAGAARAGLHRLEGRTRLLAAACAVASPALLVADLGRPSRFHHMLRVFKPTSAMSVGSWILAAYSSAAGGAGALGLLGRLPRLRAVADGAAAVLGPPMATYTAVLFSDSSIPVWHEARGQLPFVFAASAAASAGAAGTLVAPWAESAPARRLAVAGAAAELAATKVMERRLGELGQVYDHGDAGAWQKVATAATTAGVALVGMGGARTRSRQRARWRRGAGWGGSALLLAGGLAQRWAVYRAGFASAWDPRYVVKPQRQRLEEGRGHRER